MSLGCLLVDDSVRFLEAARTLLERDGLISALALKDVEELVAASPARGFLHKSDLSARAVQVVLGNGAWPAPS
ncbi:hypothetical protein [Streptomyces gilvus]|uniref:hypothetical protein n=1 Tax=Streptomyces gilvus TaxID=2920937 RepID=UPI001F0D7BDF|nr:hypothetical protein [Streptomyces sp. CME 23]MCH5673182.1 hypothetical protein [Streptomyces sp. CME 23]